VPWGGVVGSFPFRFDSFMIGVLIAFVKVNYRSVFDKLASKTNFLIVSFLFLIYLVAYGYSHGGDLESKVWWTRTVAFTITSLFMALQMPFLNNSTFLNNISDSNLIKRWLTWLSLLSYPIYLIHMDFMDVAHTSIHPLNLCINYAVIILISYLLIVFFHQPVTNSRKKFLIK
jgi:peptidoglycan/LPS O-acetylase OafA/YrhL